MTITPSRLISEDWVGESQRKSVAVSPRWKRSQSLELVYKLNEQCLELFGVLAADDACAISPWLCGNRDLWAKLNDEGRARAARMPFVILDLHFADQEWWHRDIDALTSAVHEPEFSNGLPPDLSARLVQETLMFAWQMARTDLTAAQVSFAMLPRVAEVVAGLMPSEVRYIAARSQGEIRVRWASNCNFWRALLLAATAADQETLAELQLQAKLSVLGPLIRTRPHR